MKKLTQEQFEREWVNRNKTNGAYGKYAQVEWDSMGEKMTYEEWERNYDLLADYPMGIDEVLR